MIFATIIGFECLRIFSFSLSVLFDWLFWKRNILWFTEWCPVVNTGLWSRSLEGLGVGTVPPEIWNVCVMQKVGRPLCKSISIHILKNEICFHILERLLLVLLPHTVFIKQYWMFSFWNVLDCSLGTLAKGWQPGKHTKDCSDVSLHLFSSTVWSWDEPQLSFCLRTNRLELCTHYWERILCKRLGNINCGYMILYIWKRHVK